MANRLAEAILKLGVDATEFFRGLGDAEKGIGAFGKRMESFGKDTRKVGEALLPVSAALIGLGGASLKTAIDFESSFAGVRKTVADATDEFGNLTAVGKALETGFRDMSKEIPVNVNELNKIGEAAGQLGIKSENILGFTRVMADLGVTTNLSSDEAATALARLANITQMPQDQFDRLGSTIVALGNNLATTEAEITEFGLRIAGAGAQVGLSEAQILSIGAALSSVGINAEAGGTAISKVMIDMAASVDAGGERLGMFANVAGMSADTFAEKFKTDAAGAVVAFITGLGNMESSGQSTLGVLAEMEIEETRMRDALLRASGAGDLLARSIQIGTDAWGENNALTKEAEQRYRTTASQLTLLWNQIKDVALTLGQAMLPVLMSVVETFKTWVPVIERVAQWFSNLSPRMQTVILAVGGLVAALGPALVAFGFMVTTIGAALPVLGTVGTALAAFATGPIGLVVAALAGLALAWAAWGDDITRVVSQTYHAVKSWLVDQWEGSIFQSFARMLEAMGRLVGALAELAVEKVIELYTGVKTWILDKLQPVFDAVRPLLDAVGLAFTRAKDAIIGTVTALYTGVKTWLLDKFQAIVEGVKAKIDAVTGFFNNMYTAVVGNSYVPDMITGIGAEFGKLDALMVGPARGATSLVDGLFGGLKDSLQAKVSGLIGNLQGSFDGFVKNFLPSFSGNMGGFLNGMMGSLSSIMSGGMSSLINMGLSLAIEGAKKIGEAIGNLFKSEESRKVNKPRDQFFDQYGGMEGLGAKLEEKVDGQRAHDLIKAVFDADTEGKFKSAQDAIIALVGGRKFATGGIVTRPLIGQVGEAGPEAIIPLDRFERMLAIGGGSGASAADMRLAMSGVEGRLDRLERTFVHQLPRMMETAARHGAQTAGRRR